MKKINLFTYIVFFAFILFYWFMKKSGNTIDSHSYLMVMVIVLFLLYIIRVILRFKRIKGYQDPYERIADLDEAKDNKEQAPIYTLDDARKEEKSVLVKRGILIIIMFLGIIGIRYGGRVLIADMMLDGFDTTEELFADIDRKREFRATWAEYRKEEMANGGPKYRVEDVFASTLRPDHWDDFFVLTTLPEDFYYKDREISWHEPGDHVITEIFYDYSTNTEYFYFVQAADFDYNKGHLPYNIKKEEGTFYKEEKGTRNQIIWFYEDIVLYLEGNISMDELEKVAQNAVNYNELSYDYSAIEGIVGQYE